MSFRSIFRVVSSGHSLVIQGVTPTHSGNYSCVTSNTEGDAVSRVLERRVGARRRVRGKIF